MKYDRLLADIQSRELKPIYLLHGEEPWFIDQLVDAFSKHVLEEHERDFNETILYGRDTDADTIVDAARRFPMMAERQLIIVKEAQDLPAWKQEEGREKIEKYAAQPQPSTVLVFAHKYKALASNTKVYKALAKSGEVFKSERINAQQLPTWMKDFALTRGCKMQPEVIQLLSEYLGSDLSKLVHAIEKLQFTVGDQEVTTAHVEKYIGISKDYNVFELQEAMAVKDHLKAQRIVNYFAENPKSNPIFMVVGFLYAFWSKLLIYHQLRDKSPRSMGAALKIPFNAYDTFRAAGANYPEIKTIRNIGVLRKVDREIKGVVQSSTSDADLYRQLLFDLMN